MATAKAVISGGMVRLVVTSQSDNETNEQTHNIGDLILSTLPAGQPTWDQEQIVCRLLETAFKIGEESKARQIRRALEP